MKIAIIGRSELLFETAELLVKKGFKIGVVELSPFPYEYGNVIKFAPQTQNFFQCRTLEFQQCLIYFLRDLFQIFEF